MMSEVICWFLDRTRSRARSGVRTGRSGLVPEFASSPFGDTNSSVGGLAADAGAADMPQPAAQALGAPQAPSRRGAGPRSGVDRRDPGLVRRPTGARRAESRSLAYNRC